MPARKFHDDIAAARTDAEAVEINRRLWSAHGEGRLTDADAEAISCAIDARRAALKARAAGMPSPAPTGAGGRPDASRRYPRRSSGRRREKMFGSGRPRALDRNAKVRIMHRARCLARRTEKGRAYGQITAKAVAVLEVILCVAARNRNVADAQSRAVFDADSLRRKGRSGARSLRLSARSLRRTRDRKSRRTIIETDGGEAIEEGGSREKRAVSWRLCAAGQPRRDSARKPVAELIASLQGKLHLS